MTEPQDARLDWSCHGAPAGGPAGGSESEVTGERMWMELGKGVWRENPVFRQVLGQCPALAVTNTAMNGLAMGLATAFVLVMSSLLVSSLRREPWTIMILPPGGFLVTGALLALLALMAERRRRREAAREVTP